jgi:hypothetical protein
LQTVHDRSTDRVTYRLPNGWLGVEGSIRYRRELSLLYNIALKQYHVAPSFLTLAVPSAAKKFDLAKPRP